MLNRNALMAAALFLLALWRAGAALAAETPIELAPQTEGGVDNVSISTPDFKPVESGETSYWNAEFKEWTGSRSLRLHFSSITVPEAFLGKLVISDASGAIVETFQGAALADLQDEWSKIIPGDYAMLSLISSESPVGFAARVDQVAFTGTEGVALSVIGDDDMQDVDDYARNPAINAASRAIAKLSFIRDGKQLTCTGFLYGDGKNQLMTNEHCVNSAAICKTTIATFHFQLENGTLDRGVQYRCKSFVRSNVGLDFAELELEGTPADQWGSLTLLTEDAKPGEDLMVIQHPGGRPKMISLVNCQSTKTNADGLVKGSDIAHTCDTARGSSGSPLLTLAGRVIGLHHFGKAEGPYWDENRAVRMKAIVDQLKN
ncbi:serine protease [Rhizobium ruizarguesonis]